MGNTGGDNTGGDITGGDNTGGDNTGHIPKLEDEVKENSTERVESMMESSEDTHMDKKGGVEPATVDREASGDGSDEKSEIVEKVVKVREKEDGGGQQCEDV